MKTNYEAFFRNHNPHIAAVVTYHLNIEGVLEALIRRSVVNEDALDFERMNFASKLGLCRALGLLHRETYEFVKKLNSLRNKLAHRLGHKISFSDIHALLAESDKFIDYPDEIAALTLADIEKLGVTEEELLHRVFHNTLLHIVDSQDDGFDKEFYADTK